MNSSAAAAGFTLIEVLLALAISSMAVMAGLASMQATTTHARYLQDRTVAYWVAQNALIQMRLKLDGLRPAAGRWQAQTSLAGRVWYWRAFSQPNATPDVVQIWVEVSEKEDEAAVVTLVDYWPLYWVVS